MVRNFTMVIAQPDLSTRPLRFTVERAMVAAPDVLFRAWTEQFDRWFAAPGSVLMQGQINPEAPDVSASRWRAPYGRS
jgi:hypothetical protein